jgi:WD40 repeat protein
MVPVHSLLSSAPFSILSKDLIVNIFTFLDAENLGKVAQVCKHWKSYSEEMHLWYNVHNRRWGRLGGPFASSTSSSFTTPASEPSPTLPAPVATIGGTSHTGLTWKQMYISHDRHDKRWFSSNYTSTLLKGHKKAVYCLRFDEHRIISGSDDEIRIWDLHSVLHSTGSAIGSEKERKEKKEKITKSQKKLTGHKGPVLALQFDEKKLITGGSDKTLKVWDLRSRKLLKSLTGHSQAVTCLHYTDLKLVSGSLDKMIKVWDLPSSHLTTTVGGHLEGVTAVQFLDDNKIVTGSIDKTIKIWDLRVDGSTCIRTFEGHKSEVSSIFCQNGRLMSGSKDMTIREWDLRGRGGLGTGAGRGTGTGVDSLEVVANNSCWVNVLTFDSFKLVSGCQDKTIKLFDTEGRVVKSLEGHQDAILDLQFDGSKIVSASKDKTIRIWYFGNGGGNGGVGGTSGSTMNALSSSSSSSSPVVAPSAGVTSSPSAVALNSSSDSASPGK